jgi:acetyl-CoA carboxylase carboxyltransferase component
MEEHIRKLREAKAIAALGGGEDKIAKEHAKGKLSARPALHLLHQWHYWCS